MTTRNHRSPRMIVAGIFATAGLALAGCNTAGPEEGVDVEDISEGDVAASSPAAEPSMSAGAMGYNGVYDQTFYDGADAYAGQEVTVSAEVTENISTDTFVIGGADGTAVDPLLIVEESEVPSMVEGEVVQLTGTVQQDFDVVAAEELLGLELEDELYADYVGEPYLSITSGEVIDEG